MSDKKLLAKAVLFSSVCGILILVILMCLLAAVMMSSGVISADILDYCTVGMVGVATLMSGIISSRITGSAGLAVGSLTGFFIFLVITSIALIFNGEPITILTLLKLMSSVLGGGIGGII
ncbi:MAG TPA: TIGR04086 family membrane protein, partial [Ruminococcus bromii]|nr:TIGR04086 family membrane protein [Ruminococcus bromii]